MSNPNLSAATYSRFLNLVQALRDRPQSLQLDPLEERLLNQMVALWSRGQKVTVVEAMNMSPDASAATVHRRLKILYDKGVLALEGSSTDNRVRYIVPTSATRKYLDQLGQCLHQAALT
ncbi:MAG: hypothetical protein WBI20_05835 [Burkholderiaceae bacterium]